MKRKKKYKVRDATGDVSLRGGFERLKRKNSTRLFRQRMVYAVLMIVLLAVFVVGIVGIFFRVHKITVKGNSFYNDGDIVAASGVERDMNIYLIDDRSVATAILSRFPYVRTVSVERIVPNTVELQLVCDSPSYYTEIEGEYFVLSRDMRVIQRFESKEALFAELPDIKKVTGGEVSRAVVGSEIAYTNSAYLSQGKELLSLLESAEIYSGISSVDFSDRFNVRITYDSRLQANVGNSDDLALKLRFMNEIVKDLGEAKGTIDLKDVEAAYVLLNSDGVYD